MQPADLTTGVLQHPLQISEVTAGQRPVSAVKIELPQGARGQQGWQRIPPVLKMAIREVKRHHRADVKVEPHSTSIADFSSFWISRG